MERNARHSETDLLFRLHRYTCQSFPNSIWNPAPIGSRLLPRSLTCEKAKFYTGIADVLCYNDLIKGEINARYIGLPRSHSSLLRNERGNAACQNLHEIFFNRLQVSCLGVAWPRNRKITSLHLPNHTLLKDIEYSYIWNFPGQARRCTRVCRTRRFTIPGPSAYEQGRGQCDRSSRKGRNRFALLPTSVLPRK